MVKRMRLAAACGVAVLCLTAVAPLGAGDNANKTMYLTFNRPVRLPGVGLGTGTYIFEFVDPISAWGVVHVLSRDRSMVYYQGFTTTVSRPAGMSGSQAVSFAEAPATETQPITIWWPEGESIGHRFLYPAR